jgi:hypothetical protein
MAGQGSALDVGDLTSGAEHQRREALTPGHHVHLDEAAERSRHYASVQPAVEPACMALSQSGELAERTSQATGRGGPFGLSMVDGPAGEGGIVRRALE